MFIDYILILIAVLFLGGQFAFQRLYQIKHGTAFKNTLIFNSFLGIFGAIFSLIIIAIATGNLPRFTPFSAISAMLMAFCTTTYTLLGFLMMSNSGMTLFTIFLMMGGMTLPYIYGVVFLEENCTIFNLIGLFGILAGIILANKKSSKRDARNIIIGILVFVINGICSIISKTHQIEAVYAVVSPLEFTFWTSIAKFILCGAAVPFAKGTITANRKSLGSMAVICLGAAVMFAPSSALQFAAASNLPATVLYPIISGGLIIISALAGTIFFKEKISRETLWGIILCFVGTCLFL